jgi:hypothetical protein
MFLMALDLMTEPAAAYRRGGQTVRTIMNRAFFTRLHIDGQKVVRHELREPFGVLEAAYKRRQAHGGCERTARRPSSRVAGHDAERPTLPEEDGTLDDSLSLVGRLSRFSKVLRVTLG